MRECGGCTMCCKVMGVTELSKPPLEWCKDCAIGEGCRIYGERPAGCQSFNCLWAVEDLPDEMRPDRSHVVIWATPDGKRVQVHPDDHRPGAWSLNPTRSFLRFLLSKKEQVYVVSGTLKRRLSIGDVV